MDPYVDPIWILYGSLNGSYMDPYRDPVRIIDGSLYGSHMDPDIDPIWILYATWKTWTEMPAESFIRNDMTVYSSSLF